MIHLTNDAVQKRSEDYGRFESGNKVSNLPNGSLLDFKLCRGELAACLHGHLFDISTNSALPPRACV